MSFDASIPEPESPPRAPTSQRQNPWAAFAVLPVLGSTVVYATLASLHPLLSMSALAVICLSFLFLVALAVVLIHPNRDPLDPLRLAALIFLSIYCVAPLFTEKFSWFYVREERVLYEQASIFVLVAFVFLCVGYALGPSLPAAPPPAEPDPRRQPRVAFYGLILFGVGLLAYLAAVISAGGPGRLFGGEESRVQFFKGIGWLYWAAFFMLPGGVLYFAAATAARIRVAWIHSWPLLITFLALILLQGRFRALRALICLLVLWHYRVRRFRAVELAALSAGGFGFFIFVGYARHPDIRPYLLSNPLGVIVEVATNFLHYSQSILGDTISRLPQAMLALDAFPDRVPYQWGTTLFTSLNPVLRLIGLGDLQTDNAGTTFFHLAHPEFPSWLETGYHTSLAGELLANFPWFLALPAFTLFGLMLRLLYVGLVRRGEGALVYNCLYALLLFPVLSMMIVGVGLIIFEIVVVVAPLILARPLVRVARRPPGGLAAMPDPPSSDRHGLPVS